MLLCRSFVDLLSLSDFIIYPDSVKIKQFLSFYQQNFVRIQSQTVKLIKKQLCKQSKGKNAGKESFIAYM